MSLSRALCVGVLLVGCSGPSLEVLEAGAPAERPFLSAAGDQLLLAGEPYRFVSVNAFTLTGCGNADEQYDAARLQTFFGSLRPRSLVRTYAFRTQSLAKIEAVVDAAARSGQLLELVLTHSDGSCDDDGSPKDEAWYASGFRAQYLPWVREITDHFSQNPSVGMWELVSSPIDVAPETLRAFYDEVGGVVHELAPQQLVSSGTHGPWAYGGGQSYALINASPGVDVAGVRDYAQEPGAPPNMQDALDALAGSKPLILAEAGVYASPTGDPSKELEGRVCIPWTERRDVLATWFDAAFATRLAGINVWNYLPVARTTCSYSTHETDPLFTLIHDTRVP